MTKWERVERRRKAMEAFPLRYLPEIEAAILDGRLDGFTCTTRIKGPNAGCKEITFNIAPLRAKD
jgi:hypothetical protein